MKKRALVVGLGRFGMSFAQHLAAKHWDVTALDCDMAHIEAIKDQVAYAAQGDATDIEVLKSIGAETAQVAVVAIGENFEASILCVTALKDLGVKHILVRAQTPRHAQIFKAIGVDQVIQIEHAMGKTLAEAMG